MALLKAQLFVTDMHIAAQAQDLLYFSACGGKMLCSTFFAVINVVLNDTQYYYLLHTNFCF